MQHPEPARRRADQLQKKKPDGQPQQLGPESDALYGPDLTNRRRLQLVDALIDAAERLRIGGAEVETARRARDRLQQLLVQAAPAASSGAIVPLLLSPSVSRITTLELDSSPRSRLAAVASATPIAVPSLSWPTSSSSTAVSTIS